MNRVLLTEENVWDYAEGIDFCVIFSDRVTHSYTKEEFKSIGAYPKNNRRYWFIKDGNKTYFKLNKELLIDETGKMYQEI